MHGNAYSCFYDRSSFLLCHNVYYAKKQYQGMTELLTVNMLKLDRNARYKQTKRILL